MGASTRFVALATTLVLALGVTGAGADEDATSRVDTLTATAQQATIQVSGGATFTGPAEQVAETGSSAGVLPGTDLRWASITPVSQSLLRFEIGVDDLLPGVGGTPEVVNYHWPLFVRRGNSVADVRLQAWRTTAAADLTCGAVFACPPGTVGEPRFQLLTCAPDETTGQSSCSGEEIDGEFLEDRIAFTVSAIQLGAFGGAELEPGDPNYIAASHGMSGVSWATNGSNGLGRQMFWDEFTFHPPTVQIGIAPAGTALEDVVTDVPATVTVSNGSFSAALAAPGPGDYVVVAKACLGPDSCGIAGTEVTIEG